MISLNIHFTVSKATSTRLQKVEEQSVPVLAKFNTIIKCLLSINLQCCKCPSAGLRERKLKRDV